MLCRRVDDPRLSIWYRQKLVAPSNRIKDELLNDRRTRGLLKKANRLDLELYEFVSEQLYPQFKLEYGASLDADIADFRRAKRKCPVIRDST